MIQAAQVGIGIAGREGALFGEWWFLSLVILWLPSGKLT